MTSNDVDFLRLEKSNEIVNNVNNAHDNTGTTVQSDTLSRKNSVHARFEHSTSPFEIIESFKNTFGTDSITGMYRPIEYHGVTEILLKNTEIKNEVLNKGINIRGKLYEINEIPGIWTNVLIRGIDHEISATEVLTILKPFGNVGPQKKLCFKGTNVLNGERSIRIQIKKKIPNLLKFNNRWCQLFYPGVILQCFRCKLEGHLAGGCSLGKCYNCGNNGHLRSSCTNPCFKCHTKHTTPWCTIKENISPQPTDKIEMVVDTTTLETKVVIDATTSEIKKDATGKDPLEEPMDDPLEDPMNDPLENPLKDDLLTNLETKIATTTRAQTPLFQKNLDTNTQTFGDSRNLIKKLIAPTKSSLNKKRKTNLKRTNSKKEQKNKYHNI